MFFGEVYTMSSTMKPARVQWNGGVKSGYFAYDVRGRSAHNDVIIHWERPKAGGPAVITEVSTADGRAIYPQEEPTGSQRQETPARAIHSDPSNGTGAP